MSATTYCVLTDLHANADGLRAAVEAARARGFDRLVLAGDLLTYGPDVEATLAFVDEEHSRGAVVLRGNHDQLYLDLARGDRRYFDTLPPWLQECVEWTADRMDGAAFGARYRWQDDFRDGELLVSHANPHGPGDWRYLNTDADHRAALDALSTMKARLGVFGHTHRQRIFLSGVLSAPEAGAVVEVREGDLALVNAGSVGQPRDRDRPGASFLLVRVDGHEMTVHFQCVSYDVAPYLARVASSGLSGATQEKLRTFFVSNPNGAMR